MQTIQMAMDEIQKEPLATEKKRKQKPSEIEKTGTELSSDTDICRKWSEAITVDIEMEQNIKQFVSDGCWLCLWIF